jgi:hypothetical protein
LKAKKEASKDSNKRKSSSKGGSGNEETSDTPPPPKKALHPGEELRPRGFDRGLQAEKIIGATDSSGIDQDQL